MDETSAVGEMRVATLNLWGRRGAWKERRRLLVDGFRELGPDLVALQEAVVGDGYDQAEDVLDSGYHLAHQADREAGRGADIEDGRLRLRGPYRRGPRARTGRTALVRQPHLPNCQLTFEHERELQTALVGRAIEELAEERDLRHVVLAGDLDATPRRPPCSSGVAGSSWAV